MDTPRSKNNGWILHLLIVIAMYVYYLYLWLGFIFYHGKAGWNGFEIFMMTLFTAPFYIIFHAIVFFISRSAGAKKVTIGSLTGLAACLLHICAVAACI